MEDPPPAAAPWWLPGATGQTLWARLARSRRLVRFAREVLATPDDDDLMLDHVDARPGAPRVLLLHGLEGSAHSLHTQGLALLVAAAGWHCTVLNFRSCARDPADIKRRMPNRRPRLYHSGETGDLDSWSYAGRTPPGGAAVRHRFLAGRQRPHQVPGRAGRAAAPFAPRRRCRSRTTWPPRRATWNGASARFYAHTSCAAATKALDVIARFPRETAHLDVARIRAARTFASSIGA